LRSYSE